MKNVVLVVAFDGFQQMEYAHTKAKIEAAGFTVITASTKKGAAVAKDGSTAAVDILIQDIDPQKYAGIFFIGGPGALDDLDNDQSYQLIQKSAALHKPLGAICISTRILAHAGILEGKKATGWNGDNQLPAIYKEHNVIYTQEPVTVDGTIITAVGPDQAHDFGKAIVTLLKQIA